MKKLIPFLLLFINFSLQAQSDANTYDASIANHYFEFSLKLVKETPGFTPPVAARAFGYMGLTLYESVVPGIPSHITTRGVMFGLTDVTLPEQGVDYHWPTVANNALAMIVDSLFRTASAANKDSLLQIKSYYNDLFASQISAQVFNDSKAFGEAIGTDILDYSRTDGAHDAFAHNFPADYVPPAGESLWVPFGMQQCLQPYWGENRPFIESDTSAETISPPPPPFSTEPGSVFHDYAMEVYNTSQTLTPEQSNIALYWADGGGSITPPGHSISMLKNIMVDENFNLEVAALSYAKLGIAVSDAFLACWKTKYIYNLCRPVTYIRANIDTAWLPLMNTPPFPEYPSGHSSQSGAMGAVMTDLFGSSFAFTDRTHGSNFGGPRSFDSFQEAAEEAAISRLYGGIHFVFGNQAGLNLGNIVGQNVNNLFAQVNVSTENPTDVSANLLIYPNPVQDIVTLKSNADMVGSSYQLLDMYGKVVSRGLIGDEVTTLSIQHLSAGMYILQAGEDLADTYKIVKN